MRKAGRYIPEYRSVRKQHSLLQICKDPEIAADVTITAAERLGVDAAIIFADLLLPLEVMGLDFEFRANEGPKIHKPVRDANGIAQLKSDRGADLSYVSESVRLVARHFGTRLPVIGFFGAPFTLASYMIEGGGSRHYIHTKKLMYSQPEVFDELLGKLVSVTAHYAAEQVSAGADVIQVFDSWVGCLSPHDYRRHVLPRTTELVQKLKTTRVPVIYFGTDSATLLSTMKETGADVIGLDWRIPLDEGWAQLGGRGAIQGNLDPVLLFSGWAQIESRAREVLDRAAGRAGHHVKLWRGTIPETPVQNVKDLAAFVQQYSATTSAVSANE